MTSWIEYHFAGRTPTMDGADIDCLCDLKDVTEEDGCSDEAAAVDTVLDTIIRNRGNKIED